MECSAVCSGLIIDDMAATTSTTSASSGHDTHPALALSPLAASLTTEMESDSIMLEAPALSAWRVGAMLIPSASVYPCLHSPAV